MCTVSFIPNPQGFYLAMNRDELLTRVAGLPPCVFESKGYRAIYPREPSGGTWIAMNERGICLAITNWHRVDCVPPGSLISRGEVVKSLALAGSLAEVEKGLQDLPLCHMRAFRLFAIASQEQSVKEYCWDVRQLQHHRRSWTRRHWFSSGYDEPTAERARARICEQAWHKLGAGTLGWLRELHATHLPEPGPFSICMHQAVAETVSYTEIVLRDEQITVRYQPGAPCLCGPAYEATLRGGNAVIDD
jgi:Transport and Golgi organisation 2